ncbi:hypothetical protein [Nocardiopsis synnemataformans]|uniref:hypothetical protein n=1 Tax=Nocardiopsis synnemataformans TaxID=61305 RepID=UPI003EBFB7C7
MTRPDRGRDTSRELTEVRTVWKRALSALERVGYVEQYRPDETDPDAPEMRAALEQVVALLEPWKRTGRPRRADR